MWEGNNIRLRAVELSDLEEYFLKDNNIDSLAQKASYRGMFPVGKEKMKERVSYLAKNDPLATDAFLIIEDKEGSIVGNINSHDCDSINGTFQYGLYIIEKHRKKGYASEAIQIFLQFYFLELGYQKAEVRVYSFNESSIKLHEKCGFIKEGVLRNHHYTSGKYHDVVCYGMTKEEFQICFK